MKVSLNWIKDYVKLPEDMDLTRLAYDLTMSTVEVEGAEDLAKRFEHMLVGVVTEVCPHPNADKLRICRYPGYRLRRHQPHRRDAGGRGLPRRPVPLARRG